MALHFGKIPTELDPEQIHDYLFYLQKKSKSPSQSYFKHTVYGLRFLLKCGVYQTLQPAYPAEKICKDPPLRYFKQQLEAWKTPGFARKFKSGTERFCSPDYAQKMPLLQKRKPGDHCHFRATWSATGFSFRHPNFLCEINFAGKGNYMLKRKITAFKPYKVPLLPTKKAVLLKKLLCVSKF